MLRGRDGWDGARLRCTMICVSCGPGLSGTPAGRRGVYVAVCATNTSFVGPGGGQHVCGQAVRGRVLGIILRRCIRYLGATTRACRTRTRPCARRTTTATKHTTTQRHEDTRTCRGCASRYRAPRSRSTALSHSYTLWPGGAPRPDGGRLNMTNPLDRLLVMGYGAGAGASKGLCAHVAPGRVEGERRRRFPRAPCSTQP